MSTEINLHPVQANILRTLLFTPHAHFSQLNNLNITSDHFNFHISQLLKLQLIEKVNNLYQLTTIGKEFANRFDTVTNTYEKQAKVGTCTIAVKMKDGKKYYLVHERLKQPYYGYFGFVTGKIKLGETTIQSAIRELAEETGLTASMKIRGIEHKMDYSEKGELLEDKFFYIYKASDCRGELIHKEDSSGKNHWLTLSQIKKEKKVFDDVFQLIKIIEGKKFVFIENIFTVKGF
jgi:ADP-ribose pyrophosphatase YjhB (NUDIX family)